MSAFSPHPSSQTHLSSLTYTLPLGFVHVSFIVVPKKPSPHYPLPPSPLAIIRLFLTSVSLVMFCLLFSSVHYVPVKGEIWYLSLTVWLISLSIMLSRRKSKQNITRNIEVKNNLTIARGVWGGDSEESGL